MAYEWCSLICKNDQELEDRKSLLLLSLEIGFRCFDPQYEWTFDFRLTHTEHHRGLVNVVFESGNDKAIADLLHAWTAASPYHEPAYTLLGICTEHLVDLHNLGPFSSRLRQLVIRSVSLIGYKGFEGMGVERFFRLLNHLCVTVEDVSPRSWAKLLLDILQSPEGIKHFSHWDWKLLVELASLSWWGDRPVYNPQIVISLAEAQEWVKLECWVGTVWIIWPPGAGGIAEEDLERLTLLLFHQWPNAVEKLTQWMEQWSKMWREEVPESFERICKQAQEAAQQDLL